MFRKIALFAMFLAAGCGSPPPGAENNLRAQGSEALPANSEAPLPTAVRWTLEKEDDGAELELWSGRAAPVLRLLCLAPGGTLAVNVTAFQRIGSEDRLSFGSGGDVAALAADPGGGVREGVSATGAVPGELGRMLSGPVSASYGAQVSGPHPPPPSELASAFAAACTKRGSGSPAPPATSACLSQDGREIAANRLRAIGTEPFWGARIEGRCVTYSTPDDQQGTRVWTRFSGSRDAGMWTGSLGGKPFILRTRSQAGCSDGMSDNRYPVAVELAVGGEERQGCARPL